MPQRISSRLLTYTRPLWLSDADTVYQAISECYDMAMLCSRQRETQHQVNVRRVIIDLAEDMVARAEEGSIKTVGSAAADIVAYIYERWPLHLESVPDWPGRPFNRSGDWDATTSPEYRGRAIPYADLQEICTAEEYDPAGIMVRHLHAEIDDEDVRTVAVQLQRRILADDGVYIIDIDDHLMRLRDRLRDGVEEEGA